MNLREKIKTLPVRLILSVVAGIATASVLSFITHEILHLAGVYPKPFKPMFETKLVLIALVYHSIYAIIGAYITAMLAKEKAKKAVIILGSKEAIMWVIGAVLLWKHSPVWYNITKAVLGVPIAILGGQIYIWYKGRKISNAGAVGSS